MLSDYIELWHRIWNITFSRAKPQTVPLSAASRAFRIVCEYVRTRWTSQEHTAFSIVHFEHCNPFPCSNAWWLTGEQSAHGLSALARPVVHDRNRWLTLCDCGMNRELNRFRKSFNNCRVWWEWWTFGKMQRDISLRVLSGLESQSLAAINNSGYNFLYPTPTLF